MRHQKMGAVTKRVSELEKDVCLIATKATHTEATAIHSFWIFLTMAGSSLLFAMQFCWATPNRELGHSRTAGEFSGT